MRIKTLLATTLVVPLLLMACNRADKSPTAAAPSQEKQAMVSPSQKKAPESPSSSSSQSSPSQYSPSSPSADSPAKPQQSAPEKGS